ncbi:hypothetical protein ACGFZU_34940 [Streptomyces tendae]|uniref:hypothetical protein n=1 Tax=Streptomyces tendae TaxID=1932 RepID=UPI00371D6A1A
MPEESRVTSSPIGGWTVHTELLAQLVEEVSLLASDHRREEPRTVHRPYGQEDVAAAGAPEPQQPTKPMSGHQAMLAAAARRGMVRSG